VRDDRERLRDIQEAIGRIEKHTERGREAFEHDELIQNWVVHHLQIIGEAVRHLSSQLRERHPEVAWSSIMGMRNILVHDYFAIDLNAVWKVVEHDLAELKCHVETILKQMSH
jgi:uncharacterized protein with HEPN domain